MKKMTRLLALILALSMLSTVAVGAEDAKPQGVYINSVAADYELTPLAANTDTSSSEKFMAPNTRIEGENTIYENTIAFKLTFTGEADVQYVVFLLSPGETVPKEGKIRYIDQKADGASMSFTLYPDDITEPGEYSIYLSSSKEGDAYKKVASFTVTEKPGPVPHLGDVYIDEIIDSRDALEVLKSVVGLVELNEQQLVNANTLYSDDVIDSRDALQILKYVVGLIEEF